VADNKTGEVLAVYQPNSETSRYSFVVPSGKPHNITYEAEGYMFCSVSEYSGDYKEKDSVVCLQPIKEGAVTRLSNIFFDFDDSKLRPASAYELERLYQFLLKNPGIKVEICGYADSRGTDSYNLKLSKARAQSVVTWLREKGIDPQRMVAVGYGAVKNTGRDKGIQPGDRRVELKILEIKK
jgi:outer membrane protein OmpA-like peptidoglycan-associated protein